MHFCNVCNNMYYIKLEDEDCNKIIYYCRNCGNTDKDLINSDKCVLKENIGKTEDKYSIYVNKYTKLDNTLPRIKHIKCPNEHCVSNTDKFDGEQREIIYIRYDDINMKYLYLCSHCDYIWKTN